MAEFAELLQQRKQIPTQQPVGQIEQPLGEFAERLRQRKLEQQRREAGRKQLVEQVPSLPGRISEAFTGAKRRTPETEALPEFRETEFVQAPGRTLAEQGKRMKLTAGLLTTFSPEGQMNVIREALPQAKFSQDEKGNIFVDIDGQESLLNRPGLSAQDSVRAFTNILSQIGPAKMAALGKSALARLGFVGFGSAAVEQATQEVSRLAGSQEERQPGKTAMAGVIGGATEVIGPAIRGGREALRQRRIEKGLEIAGEGISDVRQNIRAAKEAVEGVEAFTGVRVPLKRPQQTLIPSELKSMRLLQQLDSTAQKGLQAITKENKAVKRAVENAIETITPRSVLEAPETVRKSANTAIKTKEAIRAELSSPLFIESKSEIVNVGDVLQRIDGEMEPFLGVSNIKTQLSRIKSNIAKEGTTESTIGELQKAKAVIDDILNSSGESAVKGDSRRIVTGIKEELLAAMDGAGAKTPQEATQIRAAVKDAMDRVQQGIDVPESEILSFPKYAQGRIRYAQASPEVTELTGGLVGRLARLDDNQIEKLADVTFSPKTRPGTIAKTRQVLEDASPGSFDEILKFKLIDNLENIRPKTGDLPQNYAGEVLNKMFGNQQQKRSLFAGMSKEQKKNFNYLSDMLERASKGKAEGSPTASFQDIINKASSVPNLIKAIFSLRKEAVQKIGTGGYVDRRLKALGTVIFDETWVDQVKKIRRMNPNTAAAGKAMAQLLKEIDATTEGEQ